MTAIQKHHAMDATSISAVQAPRASQVLGKTAASGAITSSKAAGLASAMAGGSMAAVGSTPVTTTSTSGDITSNDFLSLLVSELKNQDPTQPTDPNAYITQMVGVNSLQQLISINQELA